MKVTFITNSDAEKQWMILNSSYPENKIQTSYKKNLMAKYLYY